MCQINRSHFPTDLFPSCSLSTLSPNSRVVLLSRLVASQPEPNWPLVLQTVVDADMAVAKLVMLHFGAFVPGKEVNEDNKDAIKGTKHERLGE